MKTLMKWLCITAFVTTLACGCTTTQKQTAYQTLSAVGLAVDNAMKAYADGVRLGLVTQEERARVAKLKMEFNISYGIACDAASYNYQAFAPEDLIKLKNSLLALLMEVTQ